MKNKNTHNKLEKMPLKKWGNMLRLPQLGPFNIKP